MNKMWRRASAVLAAGVMALSMSFSAMAATITLDVQTGSTTSTYEAYKLLNLETTLKAAAATDGHAEGEHKDDCYSYTYSVNPTYRTVLKNAINALGGTQVSDDGGIIKAMRTLDDANIRRFADSVRNKLADNELASPEYTSNTGTFENVDQGYYLIRESVIGDDPDMRSLVMVDTMGQQDITIQTKEDVPDLTKKIIENTTEVDAQDAAVGDTVHYQLKSTVPEDAYSAFKSANGSETSGFTMQFYDVLPVGLDIDEDSVVVKLNGENVGVNTAADIDGNLTDGSDYTMCAAKFVEPVGAGTTACVLHVFFDPLQFKGSSLTGELTVTVDYDCTVTDGAIHGTEGNPNTAHLLFDNDPYATTPSTATTPDDKVTVFTYQVIVNKVNAAGTALSGANFKLQKKGADGQYTDYRTLTGVTADQTQFKFEHLDAGDYKLVETQTPDGYNPGDDLEFSIVATYDKNSDDPKLTALDIKDKNGNSLTTGAKPSFTIDLTSGAGTTAFVNVSGGKLPSTGGMGTYMFYVGGAILVAGGLTAMIVLNRRKKSAE